MDHPDRRGWDLHLVAVISAFKRMRVRRNQLPGVLVRIAGQLPALLEQGLGLAVQVRVLEQAENSKLVQMLVQARLRLPRRTMASSMRIGFSYPPTPSRRPTGTARPRLWP